MINEEELREIEQRINSAQAGPWKAYIEGRDHESGSNFIMTGSEEKRGEDIEMLGATHADYDFIANARQDIPRLIKEIRDLINNCRLNTLPTTRGFLLCWLTLLTSSFVILSIFSKLFG